MKRAILAFVGPPEAESGFARIAEAHGLRQRLCEGVSLYAGEAVADRTMEDGACVLGDIFSLSGATCRSAADGWGNYLAISARDDAISVERAPLTGMPLYWTAYDGGILAFSDLEPVSGLLRHQSLDWDFVEQSLAYANLRTERTGLAGVRELLPGMRLEIVGGTAVTRQIWSPWAHVARADPRGLSDLAPALESRLTRCAKSWAAGRDEILLELSGGLDSSIVAAALVSAGSAVRAVNFVTAGPDGDERHYARMVAEHCGIDLAELPHADAVDLVGPPAELHVRPAAYAVLGGIDAAFEAEFPGRSAALFGGIGGDNVFAFDTSVAPILDALAHFGPCRRTFETFRDVARAGDATIWEAARLCWRAMQAGPSGWRRDTGFCKAEALPALPPAHPWDEGEMSAPRGKRNHVRALRRILDFVDRPRRWRDRDVIAPLLSQPLVELCLSIPSWTWVKGGRDRAVARAAFAGHLPPEIVWRRGKGRLDSLCTASYLHQRGAIRELLMGGRLAAQGLLDLPAIESYLGRDLAEGDFAYFRLLEIADMERWGRSIEASPLIAPSARHL